jgi:hypothetical protein
LAQDDIVPASRAISADGLDSETQNGRITCFESTIPCAAYFSLHPLG